VPRPANVARLELVGPTGVLDVRDVPAHAPTVHVNATRAADGGADVSWTVDAPNATSFVQVSGDGGQTWDLVAPSTNGTSLHLAADRLSPGQSTLRVVASDGVLSGEATATLGTPLPATTPASSTPTATTAPASSSPPPASSTPPKAPLPAVAVALVGLAAAALMLRRRAR
jgi:hypothetical protein